MSAEFRNETRGYATLGCISCTIVKIDSRADRRQREKSGGMTATESQ